MHEENIKKFVACLEEELKEIKNRVVLSKTTSALEHFMVDAVERAAIESGFFPCEEVSYSAIKAGGKGKKSLDLVLFDEQGRGVAAVEIEQAGKVENAVNRLRGVKIPWKILVVHSLREKRDKEWEDKVWEYTKALAQTVMNEDKQSRWLFLRILSHDEPWKEGLSRRIFGKIESFP